MPFPEYEIATETADANFDPDRLDREIRKSAISAPGLALYDGLFGRSEPPSLTVTHLRTLFTSTPTVPDQTVVDAVVAAHVGAMVEESGIVSITFKHSVDHPLTSAASVPAWDDVDNKDLNGHSYLHDVVTQEVEVFRAGLYRISYSAVAKTSASYALVRAGFYKPSAVDGFDSEVALRGSGTDVAQIQITSQILELAAGDLVTPYFYTDGAAATLVGNTVSWSIERTTARV